ncbi:MULTISPECIES: phage portal protein [unclassified Providencia]|uniref:phage portal protein n=1 Tax=unclassified Providencia TaxID=2633465 RepID=UPI002349D562|nr:MULTISPECIES: phage portal protein [unclassified Providencia]
MEQATELAATEEQTQSPEFCSFTFDPPSIVSGIGDLLDCMECNHNGRWYETPIDFTGIARSFTSSAAYHQSPLVFKRNVITSCFEPTPYLSRPDFTTLAQDFVVFGNGYLEKRINRLGDMLTLKPSLAKYTRAGVNEGQYWQVKNYQDAYEFRKNSVIHLKNPCIHQEIYGTPDYLAGLISANLNHSATLFRTNYYENGSHAGVMVYLSAALADDKAVESLKKSLTEARKGKAFKNIFVYAANGGKDGIQILPFSQISARDEFVGIKDTTRDDLLAMHRIPPQLMGIIPQGSGSLGDIEKAAMVFWFNELLPLMESMKSINDMLGVEVIRFKQYALLDFLTQAKGKEPNYK